MAEAGDTALDNATGTAATDLPQEGPVNLFISYKKEEAAEGTSVLAMKRLLARYGGSRLKVHVAAEIAAGMEWRKWIDENLRRANVLMFLYTNPNKDWGWCMLEVGQFLAQNDAQHRRVVCVHHPRISPPDPIENLQAVSATPARIRDFLADFYGKIGITGVPPELNPEHALDDDELSRQAEEIVELFEPRSLREYFFPRKIVLTIDEEDIANMCDENNEKVYCRIPDDTPVEASEWTLNSIFGLADGSFKWEALRRRAERTSDARWIGELGRAIVRAANREADLSTRHTFRAARGGAIFRPLLYRADFRYVDERDEEIPVKFHVLFTEEEAPKRVGGTGAIGTLFVALRVAHRFQGEVVRAYKGRLADWASSDEGADVACQRVSDVISLIEHESRELDLLEGSAVLNAFADGQEKAEVEELFKRWKDEIRPRLFEALRANDIRSVEQQLATLEQNNRRFMGLASRRYAELLADH